MEVIGSKTLEILDLVKPSKVKLSKCKICKQPFKRLSISHKVCSPICAIEMVAIDRAKREKKWTIERKAAIRSRSEWMKIAQSAFNAFIRKRDGLEPCISCGRHHKGQYHAGHFLTAGAHPELRFDESNCHKQCSACNNHLSGNITKYRQALMLKIGETEVNRLEGYHPPAKWTIEELKEIKATYTKKLKKLYPLMKS